VLPVASAAPDDDNLGVRQVNHAPSPISDREIGTQSGPVLSVAGLMLGGGRGRGHGVLAAGCRVGLAGAIVAEAGLAWLLRMGVPA
jgi:hypothetical protein